MRKLWIMISAILLSCIFGSGYFYFFSQYLNVPSNVVKEDATSSVLNSVLLYYNQLGVYEKTEKMEGEVASLKEKGIVVYSYKRDNLTVYVSHVSTTKSDTLEGQTELALLGYPFLLKECEVNDSEVLTLIENNDYQGALELFYEN